MSKRLEAAVKAWDHHWGDRYGDEAVEEMGEEVQVALDASDALMFSEEAVELAAREVHGEYGEFWAAMTEEQRENRRNVVRCVIEALKGFGDD